MGNGDPMREVCIPHTVYIAHRNSKGEIRGRSRHKNNCKRFAKKNLEEMNVSTRGNVPNKG